MEAKRFSREIKLALLQRIIKDCKYPNCVECTKDDCDMEQKDIAALLKRRRWNANPTEYRQKQRDYRVKIKENLPHCDECTDCVLVKKDKGEGFRRLCIVEMRLVEQKVSNSPQWCRKRVPSKDYLKRRENILRQKKEKYWKERAGNEQS